MNKYFCDACKKEITDWDDPMDYREWKEDEGDHHIELCLKCNEKLISFFKKIGVEWI